MKTTLRIFGAFLVLGVLWVMVPGVRAEDPMDRADEIGQYQADLWQQTVNDQNELRQFADDQNNYMQEMQQAQKDDADAANAWAAAQPQAPAAAPVAAPQVKAAQQPVPPDLFAGDSGGMAVSWKPGMAEAQVNPILAAVGN